MNAETALKEVLDLYDSQGDLADALTAQGQEAAGTKKDPKYSITQQGISNWVTAGYIPVKWLPRVEKLTGIPRYRLRPDVFGTAA